MRGKPKKGEYPDFLDWDRRIKEMEFIDGTSHAYDPLPKYDPSKPESKPKPREKEEDWSSFLDFDDDAPPDAKKQRDEWSFLDDDDSDDDDSDDDLFGPPPPRRRQQQQAAKEDDWFDREGEKGDAWGFLDEVFDEARDEARAEAKRKGTFLDEEDDDDDLDFLDEALGQEPVPRKRDPSKKSPVKLVDEYLRDDFMSPEKLAAEEGDDEELLKLLGLETEAQKDEFQALFDEDLGGPTSVAAETEDEELLFEEEEEEATLEDSVDADIIEEDFDENAFLREIGLDDAPTDGLLDDSGPVLGRTPEDILRIDDDDLEDFDDDDVLSSRSARTDDDDDLDDDLSDLFGFLEEESGDDVPLPPDDEEEPPPSAVMEEEEERIATTDYSKLTVVQLKAACKSRGLKQTGKKADLVARLAEADD